jgi:Ca2+-binding RTX toxin-like protein
MASIAGSQFDVTATSPSSTVNIVITSDGTLPPPVPGDFNLEVWTGGGAPTVPGAGYQGLLVDYGGQYANLISGAFSLADTGSGGHFIEASDNGQTVVGAPGDIVETLGTDTVIGLGSVILGYGGGSTFNLTTGNNTLFALSGNNDTVTGGTGNNFVFFQGSGNTYGPTGATGAIGNDTIIANAGSTGDTINAGSGNDLIYSFGQSNKIVGGSGNDTIGIFADSNTLVGGSGPETVFLDGNSNTVVFGSGSESIYAFGSNDTFVDNSTTPPYNDTIVGFDNSAGDKIDLTTNTGTTGDTYVNTVITSANGGFDTQITLQDGSTILLKNVNMASVGPGFFS